MPPPRRSSIMSHSASSRRNSSIKTQLLGFDENEAHSSGPPLELMDHIPGYDGLSFDPSVVPPPTSIAIASRGSSRSPSRTAGPVPQIKQDAFTEEQVRAALLGHVAKHSCYGRDAAKSLTVTSLQATSAFQYRLETFTERRENCWAYMPFSSMTEVDGPENGTAPLAWDIPVEPQDMFCAEVKTLLVPHTASVKHCFRCLSLGSVACQECHAKGWVRCLHCNGDGFSSEHDFKERCFFCRSSAHGFGRLDCLRCKASGRLICNQCEGSGLMIYYILLTVTWKTSISEFIKKNVTLPEKYLKSVTGAEMLSQTAGRISPLRDFPEEKINEASKNLILNHLTTLSDQKILIQRQSVHSVPIAQVKYKWKNYDGQYFVFGKENRVYAPNYPQTCCCGCILL